MAEPEERIDPVTEGKRIVRNYLNTIGWAREIRRTAISRPLMRMGERDPYLRRGDALEERAEEEFGREVDRWRHEWSRTAKEVIRTIVEQLDRRSDLTFFGRRIIGHCKRDLEKKPPRE